LGADGAEANLHNKKLLEPPRAFLFEAWRVIRASAIRWFHEAATG